MAHLSMIARRKLASYYLTRPLSYYYSSSSSSYSSSRCFPSLLFLHKTPSLPPTQQPVRFKSTRSGYSPLNDPSPNWSNRPPKETILLDGCDYEHWLIVMEFPDDPKPSEDEMINSYVKTLASVLGSDEEEAKKKIYSVSTRAYTGFGALVSEELTYKLKELPGVLWVLPDSYLDVPNKDYGGDLFIDGKVIHRPQFWYQNSPQSHSRNRSRARYDRRRETIQVQRRQPMQMQSLNHDQGHNPQQQPLPMNDQSSAQVRGEGTVVNQGPFNQSHS